MNTKLYVLGVALRTLPALVPMACTPGVPPLDRREESPRGGASKRVLPLLGGPGTGAPASPRTPPGPPSGVPTHPCELITVMQVPCDPAATTCEYTYWECPAHVKPLQA